MEEFEEGKEYLFCLVKPGAEALVPPITEYYRARGFQVYVRLDRGSYWVSGYYHKPSKVPELG